MNVRSFVVKNYHHQNIVLGRKGEFCVERVDFILNELIADYGEGTADVVFVPPNSKEEYPVVMTRNGDTVEWTITESIMAIEGEGVARVYFYPTEGGRKISCDFYCKILAGATEARDPDYLADYVHHAENIKEDATREADRAEREADRAKEEADRAKEEADRAERAVGVVRSVNGKVGEVELTAADVGALPNYTIYAESVSGSVTANASSFELRLSTSRKNATPYNSTVRLPVASNTSMGLMSPIDKTNIAQKYSKPSTGIPLKDLAVDVKESLAKADTALQEIPQEYLTEAKGKKIFPLKEDVKEISDEQSRLSETMKQVSERVDNIDDLIIQKVEPLQKQADKTDEKLDILYKLAHGQIYDVVEQEEEGHNNPPSGSKYMTVEDVRGKTEQESTNGYQEFNVPNGSAESNGITLTINDGVISIKGTARGNADFSFSKNGKIITNMYDVNAMVFAEEVGSYIISGLSDAVQTTIVRNDGSNYTVIYNSKMTKGSISETTKGNYGIRIRFRVPVGETVDVTFAPMLEKGTTEHDWEPYTGGIPSPNPEYPQEIKSVESFEVKHVGKNLFDYNSKIRELEGFTKYDGYGVINITTIKNAQYNYNDGKKLLKKGTYTFTQYCTDYGSTDIRKVRICFYLYKNYSDKTNYSMITVFGNSSTTFTIENDVWISGAVSIVDAGTYKLTHRIMLEKGSKVTEYEPYREEIRTITPPRPLNKISDYMDICDIENGIWFYAIKSENIEKVITRKAGIRESYAVYSSQVGINVCDYMVSDDGKGAAGLMHELFENKGSSIDWSISGDRGIGITSYYNDSIDTKYIYIVVDNGVIDTVQKLQELLTDKPLLYVSATTETEPINADDLAFLRSLENLPSSDNIFITDNHGRDVPYLMEYIRKLNEV